MERASGFRAIQGRHHPLVKQIRKMIRSGDMLAGGELLLETSRLIQDALDNGIPITKILISDPPTVPASKTMKKVSGQAQGMQTQVIQVPADLLASLTTTETGQGVLAFAQAPEWTEESLFLCSNPLILILEGVQDPGNLGAILRSADAFSAAGVLLTGGTVGPFNAKVIRAAAGSIFRIPILRDFSAQEVVSLLTKRGISLFSTTPVGGMAPWEANWDGGIAVALGSEGSGLSEDLKSSKYQITIPIARQVESLNVATASSLILYEANRQRKISPAAPLDKQADKPAVKPVPQAGRRRH